MDAVALQAVKETPEVSSAVVSKHLKVLTEAGYVTVSKTASRGRCDARRVAWVSITEDGRRAFDGHVAMLQQIAGRPADDRDTSPLGDPA